MLILKGKFLQPKFGSVPGALLSRLLLPPLLPLLLPLPPLPLLRRLLLCTALGWMSIAPVRAAAPQAAPDAVAAEFYGWYLEALEADQDPLSDRHATFTNYVAKALTARLLQGLNLRLGGGGGGGAAIDYFLQSPGYRSAWRRHVAAATVRQRGDGADVIVTLGNEDGAKRVLALAMVREAGSWKIRQVVLAEARPAESSAEQAAI